MSYQDLDAVLDLILQEKLLPKKNRVFTRELHDNPVQALAERGLHLTADELAQVLALPEVKGMS